jgi:serine-type D-Ala-D-Ala carboxypeptidase (penicillin-binding protein 5/6)
VPVSPAGLALGPTPFPLYGLSRRSAPNAVGVTFAHPPRAGLLVDLHSGRVLWQLEPLKRVRIASLTKMMTALVAVKAEAPGATVLVHRDDVEVAGSKVGVLPVGRRVPFESMLYGLLLPSGNDAAEAIAERVSGTVARFVLRMNEEAARLGLGCSRFASPSGYVDAGNFSCAADLAVLAHLVLEQPRLSRIVATHYAVLPFPIKGGKLYLRNINPLFASHYPGLTGIKTGETNASGRCFVATARRQGVSLAAIVLASPAPANQARKLLDSAFANVYHQPPVAEETLPPRA